MINIGIHAYILLIKVEGLKSHSIIYIYTHTHVCILYHATCTINGTNPWSTRKYHHLNSPCVKLVGSKLGVEGVASNANLTYPLFLAHRQFCRPHPMNPLAMSPCDLSLSHLTCRG